MEWRLKGWRSLSCACVVALTACVPSSETQAPPLKSAPLALLASSPELVVKNYSIGTGACAVVTCPSSDDWYIVDCGSSGGLGQGKATTAAAIAADINKSVKPHVIVTHGDKDHVNLVGAVLGTTVAEKIWLGGQSSQYTNQEFNQWLSQSGQATPVYGNDIGNAVNTTPLYNTGLSCGAANVYILAAHTDTNKNESSLFSVFLYGNYAYLFTGDATGPTQATAVQKLTTHLPGTVRILVAPHHGGTTHDSNSKDFADKVKPASVIYSSNGARYGHPRCEALNNYTNAGGLQSSPTAHAISCGTSNSSVDTQTITTAMYGTSDSGTIVYSQATEKAAPSIECKDSNLHSTSGC